MKKILDEILDMTKPQQGFRVALSLNLVFFVLIGLIIVCFQSKVNTSSALLLSFACLGLGAIIGFLFGIPRVFQNDTNGNNPNDKAKGYVQKINTNLEQISDWLTKIIVGLGLIHLYKIPNTLSNTSTIIAKSITLTKNFHEVEIFSNALILYFPCVGFFAGYLITRIILSPAFKDADINSVSIGNDTFAIDVALNKIIEFLATDLSTKGETNKLITGGVVKNILWVDDQPQNNAIEIEAFKKRGVGVTNALSTKEAINLLNSKPTFDVIISDMYRVEDSVGQAMAGINLLKELKKNNFNIRTYIYCSDKNAEAYRENALSEGAKGVFINSADLFTEI